MISPRVDRLLENVDSPYASVIVAAKRARQINSYYHNLGEGTFEEFPPPMVDTGSKNYLTIALEEVAGGKVKYRYRGQLDRPARMARILLGVTGGIAAYKALELTRLAIKAGHAVRVIQTPAAQRFVGAASFAGITGAPVLTSEWEDDPLRGAFPGDAAPAHAPIGHLELVERADVFAVAPLSANTLAKLAGGHADNLLTAAALAVPAAADPRARDERRDVRAPGHAGQPGACCASAARSCSSPARARSPRSGSRGSAACPSRPSCWPRSSARSAAAARSTA